MGSGKHALYQVWQLLSITMFIVHSSTAQAQQQELDSLKMLLDNRSIKDSVRVNILIDLAGLYTTVDIKQSLPYIQEALKISKERNYKKGEALAYTSKGTFHTITGELDTALIETLKAKSIFEFLEDDKNLIVANGILARIYEASKKYEKALEIQLNNINLVRDDPPSSRKARFYFYAAKSYQELERLQEAKKYFLEARQISKACNFSTGVAIAEGSLGTLHWQLGEYETAIKYLKRTLDFAVMTGQEANIAASCISLAKCFAGLGQYNEAIENNSRAIKIYEKQNNKRRLKDAYENHQMYFESTGNFEMANHFLRLHFATRDSLFSEEKTKIVEELQTKYETEKKEAEITYLSQQATIQELEIKQKNIAIIVGIGLFLLVSIGVYLFYRQRTLRGDQARMELEQRFLRSQLNPHFISNALLAVQNFMLKNQPEAAAQYLSKFSKLMRETLENSREEFIPLEDELKMLRNFMDIHKMRMNDAFEYQIELADDIDPEVDTIPPMFVQPFVENSIEHGIAKVRDRGMIGLRFEKEGEYITIEIKDNGAGFSGAGSKPQEHQSLSSTIIKERMDIFNKTLKRKIQLILEDIKSENDEIQGSRVELKVPFGYI